MHDLWCLDGQHYGDQGWHIGIGRYEISADTAHICKTDISVSVSITADIYRPICNIGNLLHIGGYQSKCCIISVKITVLCTEKNFCSCIPVILMTMTWQMPIFWHSHLHWAVRTALTEVLPISSRFYCSQLASQLWSAQCSLGLLLRWFVKQQFDVGPNLV